MKRYWKSCRRFLLCGFVLACLFTWAPFSFADQPARTLFGWSDQHVQTNGMMVLSGPSGLLRPNGSPECEKVDALQVRVPLL